MAIDSSPGFFESRNENSKHGRDGRLGFWSLIATQFQGAFNDNALKFLVIYLIVDMGLPDSQRDFLVLVIGALFAFPFILFSMTGGFLADRFSKRSVTIGTKFLELGIMVFALAALTRSNLVMESCAVFLLSSQGALFGPSKYGLLPELLPEKELSWGNGVIELGTFLASISATVAAGFLAFYFRGEQHWSGVVLLGCTLAGLAFSFGISRVPAANPSARFNPNPLGDLFSHLGLIRKDAVLVWANAGNFYFWFLAALLQFTIVIYGHDILHIDERHISWLQAGVAIGIGLGSLAAGYLSGGKIEYGLIPLGAIGMTVVGFLSAGSGLSVLRVGIYLTLLGFFGGFYAVPLAALIQHRPEPKHKGGIIATANLISFIGVFLAAGVYYALSAALHLGADKIFFVGACLTLLATFYAVVLLPDSSLRLALWALTHSIYRLEIEGRDNIPERGGALFVCSGGSILDACLLVASTDRRIRFLVAQEIYEHRAIRPFARMLGCIPIRSQLHPKETQRALRAARAAIEAGDVVCVFSRQPRRTLRRFGGLTAGLAAPIVPVTLGDTCGGVFDIERGRLRWKFPKGILCRVAVSYGTPAMAVPAAIELPQGVYES